jgi:hypothetical protein
VATPSTWNPHLPRLAGDGEWLYALHTWYADDLGERYAAILERPAEGGEWAEVARVLYPHQPPGMVVDRDGALHLVFVCMPDGGTDQTCFPGGAGTSGAQPRFYHLVFSGRDESGRLRWNTYTNVNEWPGPTNGYLGLGTTADGLTWWSLADSDWSRVVQWWADVTSHGTVARLSEADRYLLYPIHLAHPDRASADLAMVVGDFDPAGGTNAGYPGATAFRGATSGLGEVWSREDADPVEGAVGVFPGDAALDDDGLHILSYVDEGGCYTELDDAGLLSRLDCLGTYARLLEGEHGRWILAPTAGEGRLRLYWEEEGAWRPVDLELDGELPEGEVLYNFIPAGADASPLLFGDGRHRLLASGMDEEGLSQRSYLVELEGL